MMQTMTRRIVIHRGAPRWFEIRGHRYTVHGGSANSRDDLDAGWGYTVMASDNSWESDETMVHLDDVREWAQEWEDHPEWGYPEDEAH